MYVYFHLVHVIITFMFLENMLEKLWNFEKIITIFQSLARNEDIVIFYNEILTGKVVLWCFFSSETHEKIHKSTFQVKISV